MSTAQTVIENTVIEVLAHTGPCTMDEVVGLLPKHGWSEIFSAVDEMSRDGRLVLRRSSNSVYQLSLSPLWQGDRTERTGPAQVRFCVGCGYLRDEGESEDGSSPWVEASRYLKKYGLTWIALDRTDAMCPACSRVQACGTHR
ncbi:MAG: hypothetical protein KF693_16910, partial [Nitrospira sp.]|nr:hypothetical protein [Nitrospira sp.]